MTESSYKSLTPHYVWAETLEEQEAQLRANPLLQRMIASRGRRRRVIRIGRSTTMSILRTI